MNLLSQAANGFLIIQYLTTPLIFLSIIQLNRSSKVGKTIKIIRVVSTCLYLFKIFCLLRAITLATQAQNVIISLCEIAIITTMLYIITDFYTGHNSIFTSKYHFYSYGIKETLKPFFTRS